MLIYTFFFFYFVPTYIPSNNDAYLKQTAPGKIPTLNRATVLGAKMKLSPNHITVQRAMFA